jgi:SAM-dependent methyltransferase
LRLATSLKLRLRDLRESDPLVPPRRLQFVGEGDFKATGDEFLGHFRELCNLQRSEDVLDVGCGIGRIARPLVGYLADGGTYSGFDPNAVGIGWCQSRYPEHFRFTLVDLYNARYHPTGRLKASEVRFPYDDDSFDFVVLTSVLTHLLEAEAAHYLREAARVLRPGGRVLATLFLLDTQSREAMAEERTALTFLQPDAHVAVARDDIPEEAVAYDEDWVRQRVHEAGLTVQEPVRPGTWRGIGSPPARSFQDIVVLCA